MQPVLFELGPFTVYSYGFMMALGFLAAYTVLYTEHVRLRFDRANASSILLVGMLCGLAGSKLLFVFTDWNRFLADPAGMIFSPEGFVWYGGFAGGLIGMLVYIHIKKLPYWKYLDMIGLGGMAGYAVGRLGCHLAGDGDYGVPTELPWGTDYSNGVVKPAAGAADYFERNPGEASRWNYEELTANVIGSDRFGTITQFDVAVALHPTPVYEFLMGAIIFFILWVLRVKLRPAGMLFGVYLLLMAVQRFTIEFIRLNPVAGFGLTQAQLISIILFFAGLGLLLYLRSSRGTS